MVCKDIRNDFLGDKIGKLLIDRKGRRGNFL
jgi:hypothetical protein